MSIPFVPAISGASIRSKSCRDVAYMGLEAVRELRYPTLMISVFDFVNPKGVFLKEGIECINNGISAAECLALPRDLTLYLDSGGYELTKFGIKTWYDALDVYAIQQVLRGEVWTILDYPARGKRRSEIARAIASNIRFAEQVCALHYGPARLMAVAHGSNSEELYSVSSKLLSLSEISIIAVSDKELPLAQTAKKSLIQRLAGALADQRKDVGLHILGIGSPVNWTDYVHWGVTTFDSTNWLVKLLNPTTLNWTASSKGWGPNCECTFCREFSRPLRAARPHTLDSIRHNLALIKDVL